MPPPITPTPLSPYEKDGQEFGLVPKYVLRKKAPAALASTSSHEFQTPTKKQSQISGNSTPLNDHNSEHSNNITRMREMMKDVAEDDDDDDNSSLFSNSFFSPPKKKSRNKALTPQQIHSLLQETDALLARRWRVASLVDSPSFDSDKKLLLQMENYQPHKAANRIEEHWKCKLELFGPELVEKKLLLVDVSKSTKTEVGVEDGYIQLLPTRDLAGRAVLFFHYDSTLYHKQIKQFRRVMFYMMATALQDEETCKRGITLVVWNHSSNASWLFDPFWNAYSKLCLPYRIHKLHYCQEAHDLPYVVQEKREKDTDIRIHKGSLQECLHGLVVKYGIPSHFLPLTFDGELDRKEHLKWMELRRRIESFPLPQQKNVVLVPSQDDVLLGKRKMSMNGNVIYHQMVASNLEAYHEATEEEKYKIRLEIWTCITKRGGRFLLQIENAQIWEKLDLHPAMTKITQAFDFLCAQYFFKDGNGTNGAKTRSSPYEDHLFFGWIFDKRRCFDLIHCKGEGGKACW